ncbi:phage tail protein [Glutamicibacter arilaitensis]|uniref:phage tail protein n=1 Tax=Glutamicibacter arilaitensis TaxID=256701 RepID=UPI003FD4F9B3
MPGGEIAKAWVSIIPTTKGIGKGIESELGGVGDKGGKRAGRGFVKGFVGIATAAAGAVATASFLKGSIAAAGDLEQSMGAIDAVFKGSSGEMHKWAKSASNDVGLTQNEFNELGTLIGSQLKNGGTAMDELAPKTNQLIGLGADLSSMFGGTSREAVEALSSALKGERDPIERYGVSLNQAKIDAEAAALGFKKVGGSLSDEANQAATLSLIMKQTKDAHGNFAKESNTYQGQLQRLTTAWGNVSAQVGTAFLPVLTGALTFVNTKVMPMITAFADKLGEGGLGAAFSGLSGILGPIASEISGGFTAMFAAFQDGEDEITSSGLAGFLEGIGVVARNLFDAFGPLIPQILDFVTSFSPLSLILQAIGPLLPQIVDMFGALAVMFAQVIAAVLPLASALLSQIVPVFMQLISAVLPVVIDLVTSLISAFAPLVAQLMTSLAPILTQLAQTVFPLVASALTAILGAIVPVVNILIAVLIPVIRALLPVVTSVFGAIAQIIKAALQIVTGIIQVVTGLISGNWSQVWNGIVNILKGVWNLIIGAVRLAINLVMGIIRTVLGVIVGLWKGLWTGIFQFLRGTWNSITSLIESAANGVKNFLAGIWRGIKSTAISIWNALVGWIQGIPGRFLAGLSAISKLAGNMARWVLGMKNAAVRKFSELVSWVSGLPRHILGALGNMGSLLVNAGKQILSGFLNGLKRGFESVKNFVGGIGSWIADHKGPKAYDLALLVPAGGWIMDGLGSGIEDSMGALKTTLGDVSWMIENGIDPEVEGGINARVSAAVPATSGRASSIAPASASASEQGANAEGNAQVRPVTVKVENMTVDSEDRAGQVAQELWTRADRAERSKGKVNLGGVAV